MAGNRISRNDPCPCGSGKKFKNCCISKGIDWDARQAAANRPRLPLSAPGPRTSLPPDLPFRGPFDVIDARLKAMARETPGQAAWKTLAERLSDATFSSVRIAAYKVVRDAGVLPADVVLFLFDHTVQWMPFEDGDFDPHVKATLQRFGLDDMADLYANDRLDYDRRRERGRQFFFGPPDEEFAAHLRKKGVID